MNKLANALYAYQPKNDDELELKVGDKIEVIGFEEEGWWRGRLRGTVGVFPSNFVQVIEGSSSLSNNVSNLPPTPNIQGKVNLFGASKNSKTSLSSSSLNSNTSGSYNNNNTISTTNNNGTGIILNSSNSSNGNNNLTMNNNTQQQQQQQQDVQPGTSSGYDTSSERRPKPIRGVGYGDIFAMGGIRSKASSTEAGERSSNSTLQKQVPKKPPPPTPFSQESLSNQNFISDQAPALPPKPANQFSPHLHHPKPLSVAQASQAPQQLSSQQVREQARVIYCYKAANDDELDLKPNDIINVLDRDIEDYGWWKGELNGKVGVFPDNFVELIPRGLRSNPTTGADRSPTMPPTTPSASNQQTPSSYIQGVESKMRSVFAATPKGFSRELESNLEKHNNPASFLSLKRNKIQQQTQSSITGQDLPFRQENGGKEILETTTKLNHMTANRAKGPTRRPPSSILNKRNQLDQHTKKDALWSEDGSSSVPITTGTSPSAINDSLASLPTVPNASSALSSLSNRFQDSQQSPAIMKPSLSLDNVIDSNTPKTVSRAPQPQTPAEDKSKSSGAPIWMVELRKAQAEKKRDTPAANVSNTDDDPQSQSTSSALNSQSQNASTMTENTTSEKKQSVSALRDSFDPSIVSTPSATRNLTSRYSIDTNGSHQQSELLATQRSSMKSNPAASNPPELPSVIEPLSSNRFINQYNKNSNNNLAKPENSISGSGTNVHVSNENGNNTSNVPTSITKLPSGPQTVINPTNQMCSLNDGANQLTPSFFRSNLSKPGENDQRSPERNKADCVAPALTQEQMDNLLKQISRNVDSELSSLKQEVGKMKEELKVIPELKSMMESIKDELTACQNATESQKRCIKELIGNLADERKKLTAMKLEMDRNLK